MVIRNNKNKLGIQITTVDNVVYLTGMAAVNEMRKLMETIHSIKDIKDVDTSNLRVTDAKISKIHDIALTSKIRGALIRERFFKDKSFEFDKIKVKSKNGDVVLFGRPTELDAAKAERITKNIKGVKNVAMSFRNDANKRMK